MRRGPAGEEKTRVAADSFDHYQRPRCRIVRRPKRLGIARRDASSENRPCLVRRLARKIRDPIEAAAAPLCRASKKGPSHMAPHVEIVVSRDDAIAPGREVCCPANRRIGRPSPGCRWR